MTIKINGLVCDIEQISSGLYDLIVERGEDGVVAFGMLPKWAMDSCEQQVRRRVVELAAKQIGTTAENLESGGWIHQESLNETVAEIMKKVASGIYTVASKRGAMVV